MPVLRLGQSFLGLCLFLFVSAVHAQTPDPILFSIGSAMGNPSDIVEIPVSMNAGNTQPSTFILWIRFDTQQLSPKENNYQFVQESSLSGGVPTSTTSFARPEAVVSNADRFIETNVPQPGTIVILVSGDPATTVGDGHILTLAFTINAAAQLGDTIAIEGVIEGAAPLGSKQNSSAADSSSNPVAIPVLFANGLVTVGCSPASNVLNVSASTDRKDGVLVQWDAVPEAGAQYRVFRNTVNNAATAQPLGLEWQSATSFLDITAAVPIVNDPGGCFSPPDFTRITYFYWVKARSASACLSENFSTPVAQGSRDYTPSKSADAQIQEKNLPATRATSSTFNVTPDSPIALRLDGGASPVDVNTVWASATGENWEADTFAVHPVNEKGAVWVSFYPEGGWEIGDRILLEAGALTANGDAVGPNIVEYLVVSGNQKLSTIPEFPESVGDVFTVPSAVFTQAQTFEFPIPATHTGQQLHLYYYAQDAFGGIWVRAQNVDGLLVSLDQQDEALVAALRHGGVFQLGTTPQSPTVKQNNAAVFPGLSSPRSLADLLIFVILSALLAGATLRRQRA